MRVHHFLLTEMNVSNLDTIKTQFTGMLTAILSHKQIAMDAGLLNFIVKRAVKAMQNDDAGHMVTKAPLDRNTLSNASPAWLRTAVERGDDVWDIAFKDGFHDRLAHVCDWFQADPQGATRVIRAAPEIDFLGALGAAADEFFKTASAEKQKAEGESLVEDGREVVMTFRHNPKTNTTHMFSENTLAPNEHGQVVMFWAKLVSNAALNREGVLMDHCVKNTHYANLVAANEITIYSLRDMRNQPHCTIELQLSGRAPAIHQVKGKGNRPPTGKYAFFVRDFLNAIGARASGTGATDVEGLGLLTHDGKYGTIGDIGGHVIASFANGDTIRTLAATEKGSHWQKETSQKFFYLEKDNTTPFVFSIRLPVMPDEMADPRDIAGKAVSTFSMLRKEVSKFPIYQKNLIGWLTANTLKASASKVMEQIGILYDNTASKWGTREQLAETLFTHKGVTVSRIVEDVYFSDSKNTIFATALYRAGSGLRSVTTINVVEATKLIPELVMEFANKVIQTSLWKSKDSRDYLASFGVFWNENKDCYTGVPDDEKRVLFRSKTGSLRLYKLRLYFYDASGTLIGCYAIGMDNAPYLLDFERFDTYSSEGKIALCKLLADITAQRYDLLRVKDARGSNLRELGFYRDGSGRLIALEEVEKSVKLADGYSYEVSVSGQGDKTLALLQGHREVADVILDEAGNCELRSSSGYARNRISMKPLESPNVLKDRIALAAMLNAMGVGCSFRSMLGNGLQIKGDKYAAIDPQKDTLLTQFAVGTVALGHGLRFKQAIYFERNRNDDEETDKGRFGYIDGEDHSTLCNIDYDHGDLVYRMRKRLPDGVSRAQVIKVLAQFMHEYHDKLERYMDPGIFKPIAPAKKR